MKYLKGIEKFVENKEVFCGMDIHKHHWNLCYFCQGEVVEKIRIDGTTMKLLSHTENMYSTAHALHFVYEAGFSGFYLFRKLVDRVSGLLPSPPNLGEISIVVFLLSSIHFYIGVLSQIRGHVHHGPVVGVIEGVAV